MSYILPNLLTFEEAKNMLENNYLTAYRHFCAKNFKVFNNIDSPDDMNNDLVLYFLPSILFNLMFDVNSVLYIEHAHIKIIYTDQFIGEVDFEDPDVLNKFYKIFEDGIIAYGIEEPYKYISEKYQQSDIKYVGQKHTILQNFFYSISNIFGISMKRSDKSHALYVFFDNNFIYQNTIKQNNTLYHLAFKKIQPALLLR